MKAREIADSVIATTDTKNIGKVKDKINYFISRTFGQTNTKHSTDLKRAVVLKLRKHGIKI